METGQRGFVITGQEEFLEPYAAGRSAFDALMVHQKELVRDEPGQVLALERIERLVRQWEKVASGKRGSRHLPLLPVARRKHLTIVCATPDRRIRSH